MDFDALLAELTPMHKAMAVDGDAKITAAAEEAGADTASVATEGKEGTTEAGAGDDVLGKSFDVTLPDGTVQEVFDAADLVKSLSVRLDTAETAVVQHGADLDGAREDLTKALTVTSKLFDIVKTQDTLIKSLQADVKRIGNQPLGRKAAVTIADRNPAPAVITKPNGEQIMAKAMSLIGNGISSSDIATVEMSLQRGMPIPAHLDAILSAAS